MDNAWFVTLECLQAKIEPKLDSLLAIPKTGSNPEDSPTKKYYCTE